MSYPSKRVELKELNPHIMCVLCGGYLIQATTIIECLHSFCKSCILNFLETSDVCPICDVKVHKTWPLMNIRLDQTLQSLVYKMVPGLFQDEMRKRREYHWTVSDSYVKTLNLEERGDAVMEKEFTTGPDQISLVLQMVSREEESSSLQVVDQRYLLCPAEFTIGLLKKFVRMKFDLTSQNKIVMYKAKEELTDDLMLQDVAYIYLWKKDKPFHLFYSVGKSPFLRKRWSCPPTKKSISAALTSVSTAIGTFLAREDSPPASVINTTADTKTVPKLTSVIPSRETTVKSQKVDTKTNIKRIKSEELHGPPSSKSSQMAKTTSASVAPSPSASLPNTFPPTPSSVIATTSTTMMPSKCTVTSVSSPPSSSSSLSSPMPPHKKGPLCSSSSSSPLSSSSSSSLTSTSMPILSSNNTVLKTTISPSSTSLTSTSAKQNGATTPVKSLHPGPKKSSMPTDQQVKSGNLVNSPPPHLQSSSKRKTEAVKSTKSLGQIPAVSYSKSSVIQDQAKIRIPKTVLVPVQESPKITSSNTFVPNSISKPVSNSHKTTMGTSTTITKSSYSNTLCSSNDFRTYNSHLSHTSPIPKVATTTASITTPKHNVHSKVYSVTSSNKALASSPDNNKSYKIKIQSSPSLSDVNVKDQVKQFAIPSPNTPVDQTGRVRKHKQQPGSSPQTVPSLSPGPKPSPVKDGHKSRGEISAGPTGNNSKLVTGAGSNSQLECNKSQNAGTDIGKQSSKVNIVNSKSECSNRVSYAKSSAPLPSLSSPSSSLKSSSSSSSSLSSPSSSTTSSIPTSPLLAKSFSNSGRIIHSVESILSPTPKQDSSKLVNKTDVMDKTSALSKEKSLRLDCDMPKDLNEVTAQYVTTVWKEAFGNTITNKVDKKVDICDNKLLSKQKVQSNVSPKLPVQFSKAQKPLNGNGNSLKRPNKDTDTVSVAIKSNKILVDNKKCSSNEDSKMDYLQHVPSSSPSLNNHQSKVPNDRQMKSENKDSQKCSPVPSQHSPKCQRRPPVLLHKSMSCDESKSSSQQKNMNVVSPLEKRNWKKRKLSEIDQELSSSLSSPQMSTTLSHPQQQIGVKRRCLTPDVVTKAIVDEFGKCCETVEDRKNTVNSSSGGKESSDSAFSSFPHSSPLLPFKQGLDYHRQLHLQNYQHYHHFHNNKNQANFPPMTTSALFLRTLPDSVVKSNQMAINASYVTNNNNNTNRVCKQVNNSCPNPIQSQPPKTATNPSSTSTSSTSRPSPADLSRFYSKSSTTTGTGTDKIETEPMSTASSHNHNHNHDRNNNTSVMGHDTDHLSKPGDKHRKMNQAISNKPLDRQSLTSTSASSSSSSYSKINSTYSSSGVFLDSHQRQYSPKTKAAVNHEYRVARGQHQPSLHPYHQPTLPSPGAKPSDSVKKLYDYSKKNEQDVTRNISIDVNSSSNTITPIASTSDNSAVSVSSESSMSSSPSQTSPSNSTCTVMTSPRSSLTSPGTDATSPGTEDRLDNAVLPVECRTPCDDGGASTPPYAMASILTTSVSSKPSTPLDLTNKPRKVQ